MPAPELVSPMRRAWHRIGLRLSLFAMLMPLLGPLISQGTSLAHEMSAPLSMAEMPCDNAAPDPQHSAHQHACADHNPALWETCGYCTLLFQQPPLTESGPFISRLRSPLTTAVHARSAPGPTTTPVFPGARTRAPPQRFC